MAMMFVQQSQEYIQQSKEEIERLQQLLKQVRGTVQSEEQLETAEPRTIRIAQTLDAQSNLNSPK